MGSEIVGRLVCRGHRWSDPPVPPQEEPCPEEGGRGGGGGGGEEEDTAGDVAVAAAWPARWCCLFVPLGVEEEEEEEQEKAPEGSSSSLWTSLCPSATSSSSRKCAQIQFIYDLRTFLLCSRDRYPQCCSQSWCSSWARSLCPCCATTGAWFDGAENCGVPAVAFHRRSSTFPFVSLDCERDGGTSARRRRERRLRSWWRHEQQSVRAAAHRSAAKVAASEEYSGLRAQMTVSAGRRGVLTEPEPQGAVTDGYVAAPVPSLAVPLLAGAADEVVDSTALRFLTAKALEAKRKEEQEKVFQELDVLFRIRVDQLTPLQQRWLAEHRRSGAVEAWRAAVLENRRNVVVKKRKKKLPETSSHLSRGRARRRIRQCCVPGWSCWFSASHAVFPSLVGRPKLVGIMISMDQDDSFLRALLRLRQWHMLGWFCWLLLALCSLLLSTGPLGHVVLARRCVATTGARFGDSVLRCPWGSTDAVRFRQWHAQGSFCCSFLGCQTHDVPHHGRYEPEGQLRCEILADMPVVHNHRCLWFRLQKNCGFPQVQFIKVVDISFVLQRLIPMVLATIQLPQLRVDKVIDVPVHRSARRRLCRQIPMVQTALRTMVFRSCSSWIRCSLTAGASTRPSMCQ